MSVCVSRGFHLAVVHPRRAAAGALACRRACFASSSLERQRIGRVQPISQSTLERPQQDSLSLTQRRWNHSQQDSPSSAILYEGPWGQLITHMKRVSITSTLLSLVGVPALAISKGVDIGPFLAGGMILLTTSISTFGLHFTFGPYITRLERIPVRGVCFQKQPEDDGESAPQEPAPRDDDVLLKATTRSILSLPKETVFDPAMDVIPYEGIRPICNFVAKGTPLYIHPELLEDADLRKTLRLEENTPSKAPIRLDDEDDEFM